MRADGARRLRLEIPVESDDEVAALRGALLSARASELAEARRQSGRSALGYGSDTTRESMSDTSRHRTLRSVMLDRVLTALEASQRAEG